MREILFRGINKLSDGWVEGYLVKTGDHYRISTRNDLISFGVNPETVGEYSGRTDRNGKKIFEGDIVKTWLEGGAHSGFSWPLGVVEFRESAFGVAHGKYKFTPFSSYAPRVLMEVVGNIHDNPELLKEGE